MPRSAVFRRGAVVDVVNKGRFAYFKGSPTMEITEFVWGGQVEILNSLH